MKTTRTFKQNAIRSLKFLGIIFGALVLLFIALIIVVSIVDPVPATTAHSPQAEAPTHIAAYATTVPIVRPTVKPSIPVIASTATVRPVIVPTAVPTKVPALAPTVDIATLPAYQLAAIDGADFTNPSVIATYQTVLDSLHNKTGDSERVIADDTYSGQTQLTKDNYAGDDSMLTLMNGVDTAITKDERQKYAPTLAALIVLMEG
jgi:hypothetical protein